MDDQEEVTEEMFDPPETTVGKPDCDICGGCGYYNLGSGLKPCPCWFDASKDDEIPF